MEKASGAASAPHGVTGQCHTSSWGQSVEVQCKHNGQTPSKTLGNSSKLNEVISRTPCECMKSVTTSVTKYDALTSTETVTVKDPPDVLDRQKCLDALAALRHAKWFQVRLSFNLLSISLITLQATVLCHVANIVIIHHKTTCPRAQDLRSTYTS